MTPFWSALLQYGLSAIIGGLSGLAASYFNWGIEKRRQVLQRRRDLVTGWRMELLPLIAQPRVFSQVWAGDRQRAVMSSPYYASLRPHLTEEAREQIEHPVIKGFISRGGQAPPHDWAHHYPLKVFVDEIARIEREWKLV
jgi:hypothetical protein